MDSKSLASKFPLFIRLKLFKYIISSILILIIIVIIYANYNLYYQPELQKHSGVLIDQDLLKQLNYLEKSLDNGVAYEMQKQYPEGLFFSYLMYGLAWCEFALDLPEGSPLKNKAVDEAINSLDKLEQDYCKQSFYKNLPLQYGAFYFSWTNYLRGKTLLLSDTFSTRDKLISDFNFNCDTLSKMILDSDSPFFESYPNQYWPADIVPGIVSLSIHDKLFTSKYKKTIDNWFDDVKQSKDIFPHSVSSKGETLQGRRGSSFGLILIILKEIPENYFDGLIKLYIRNYSSYFLGLPMIKEYTGNDKVIEDVDSGPIVFGNGSVATIIGAGVYKRFGLLDKSEQISQTIECLGFPCEDSGTKKYLLGKVPMADFFIAWVKSMKTLEYKTYNTNSSQHRRLTFQIVSLVIVLILALLLLKIIRSISQV